MLLFQHCFKKLFILVLLCLISSFGYSEDIKVTKIIGEGEAAPINILREAVSNKEYTFPEKGKWNIVFYWSLFCHSCLQEIPAVKKRLKDNDDFSVFFVSLDSEQMQTGLKNFSLKRKLGKPLLMEKIIDSKYLTADQWGVVTTPSVFIVNPDGIVVFSHSGPMDVENIFIKFENLRNEYMVKQ